MTAVPAQVTPGCCPRLGCAMTLVLVLVCLNTGKNWVPQTLFPWKVQNVGPGQRRRVMPLWRTGASEECIAQGQGYTSPFGEWIQCLNTKSPIPIPMRSSWVVPRTWTCFQCNPSCSQPTFPELSSGKFKGENTLFTSLLFYLLPLAFWQNFLKNENRFTDLSVILYAVNPVTLQVHPLEVFNSSSPSCGHNQLRFWHMDQKNQDTVYKPLHKIKARPIY